MKIDWPRIKKRVVSTTQSATPTINTDNGDIFTITGLAQAITSFTTNLSGTPVAGDMIMIQITDNGTARALTFWASFSATTVALPTTTAPSTTLSLEFQWNGSTWACISNGWWETASTTKISLFWIPLTGAQHIRIFGSNLTTWDTDLYTCPASKRTFIYPVLSAYNWSAWSITYYPELKVWGTYYRLGSSATLTTWTRGTSWAILWWGIVLEAWEKFSVNTATTNWLNIAFIWIEYDDTNPVFVKKILALANGNNTLYTVPAWKTASPVHSQNIWQTAASVVVLNGTAGSLNYILYSVPNWWSPDSTNQLYPSTATGAWALGNYTSTSSLNTWDSIVINTSSWNAWQSAWINIVEI